MREEKIYARTSESLTAKAKAIFGGIVLEALVATRSIYGLDGISAKYLSNFVHHHDQDTSDEIDLEYGEIIIRFTNGATIKVESSEWGSIAKIAEDGFLRI